MSSEKDKKPERPNQRRSAIVQCEGFRCWATKIPGTEWIDFNGKEVKVIEVITELANW